MEYRINDIVGLYNSDTLRYKVLKVEDEYMDVQHAVSQEIYSRQAKRIFHLVERHKITNAERIENRRKAHEA